MQRGTDWQTNSVYVLRSIDDLKDEVHALRNQLTDDRAELFTKFDEFKDEMRDQHTQTREEFAILKGQATVIASIAAIIITAVTNFIFTE